MENQIYLSKKLSKISEDTIDKKSQQTILDFGIHLYDTRALTEKNFTISTWDVVSLYISIHSPGAKESDPSKS